MSLDEFSFEILICVGHFRVFPEVITKEDVSVPLPFYAYDKCSQRTIV
jgi:hypothetical protein